MADTTSLQLSLSQGVSVEDGIAVGLPAQAAEFNGSAFHGALAKPQSLKLAPRSGRHARPPKVRPDRPPMSWTAPGQSTRAAARAYVTMPAEPPVGVSGRHLTSAWTQTGRGRRMVPGLARPGISA
jgi:hypothetical protein